MRSRRAAASDSAQWTRLNERFRKAKRKVNEGTKGTMPHVCGGVRDCQYRENLQGKSTLKCSRPPKRPPRCGRSERAEAWAQRRCTRRRPHTPPPTHAPPAHAMPTMIMILPHPRFR